MKRLLAVTIAVLLFAGAAHAIGNTVPSKSSGDSKIAYLPDSKVPTGKVTKVYRPPVIKPEPKPMPKPKPKPYPKPDPDSSANANASASANSNANVNVNAGSVTNYDTRTDAPTVFPPYLPYWNHGGWGTIKAYFSNGPNKDDRVYERTFDPENSTDMSQLRGVLQSLPYDGPIEAVGGFLNTVGAVLCGIDNFHHGRGFEIANSLVRERRRNGKPLLVFIDTNVDTNQLRKAGYAYMGKVSIEGNINRNWDQVYDAAIAETLPWDVDILLVSGGMKGVTVGSTSAFPGAGGAYSQSNYAISLFGSVSNGVTEGKGKATLSAEGYRFSPAALQRRRIPESFYDKIRATISAAPRPTYRNMERAHITTPRELQAPQQYSRVETAPSAPISSSKRAVIRATAAQKPATPEIKKNVTGVEISRKLWEVAGFEDDDLVEYVIIR